MQELTNGTSDSWIYTVTNTTKTNPKTSGGKAIELNGTQQSNNGMYTAYWSYESDGDVSIFPNPSGDAASWLTLPFITHNQISASYVDGAIPPDTIYTTAVWNSSGTYTVDGQQHSTDSVTVTVTYNNGSSSAPFVTYHYTYLPDLGIIAIENTDGGADDWLISYSLK
jgi:hypothetical protein